MNISSKKKERVSESICGNLKRIFLNLDKAWLRKSTINGRGKRQVQTLIADMKEFTLEVQFARI